MTVGDSNLIILMVCFLLLWGNMQLCMPACFF